MIETNNNTTTPSKIIHLITFLKDYAKVSDKDLEAILKDHRVALTALLNHFEKNSMKKRK